MDAYRLAPYLKLAHIGSNDAVDGATGRLTIDNDPRVPRTLMWARFSWGEPGALAAEPAPAPSQ